MFALLSALFLLMLFTALDVHAKYVLVFVIVLFFFGVLCPKIYIIDFNFLSKHFVIVK